MQATMSSSEGLTQMPDGALTVPPLATGAAVDFSLVIPTLNERQNLEELIAQAKTAIELAVGASYEIIVVDDDSADETWKLAAEIAMRDSHVLAIRRTTERGLATAVVRGWQAAHGQWLGVIDGDLQHPPEALTRLIEALRKGADLAVASRDVEGGGTSDWSAMRGLISRGSRALGRVVLPKALSRVSDPMTGYFAVRRTALAGSTLNPCGYKILVELLARAQVKTITEVGYVFRSRQHGESKASPKVFIEYLQHLIRLRHELRQAEAAAQLKSRTAAVGKN
jgi:dolichol-phosphate mannosyltransferase